MLRTSNSRGDEVAASLLAADPELMVDHVIETVREVRPNVRLAKESARRLLHRYRDRLRAGDGLDRREARRG